MSTHPLSRIAPYQGLAEGFYSQMMGKQETLEVKLTPSVPYAAARPDTKILYLHPLVLLSPKDLPRDLRITGGDDPKLRSSAYFLKLKNFLSRTFQIDAEHIPALEKVFLVHARLWEKPHLLNQVRKFVIAHEVSHIYFGHATRLWDAPLAQIVSLVATVFFLGAFALPVALVVSLVMIHIFFQGFKLLRGFSQQFQEREADLKALEITKDFPGARAFFKALDQSYQDEWNQESILEKLSRILFYPESLVRSTHPAPLKRIEYLRKSQKSGKLALYESSPAAPTSFSSRMAQKLRA
jgi:hypothetical protein